MTQFELDRAVAQATGEEIREIRHRGFSVADPAEVCFDPEPNWLPPSTVDWDRLDRNRTAVFPSRRRRELAAFAGV